MKQFNLGGDTAITSSTEAYELQQRFSMRIGNLVQKKIRSMASMLVNGARWDSDKYNHRSRRDPDESLWCYSDTSQNIRSKGFFFYDRCKPVTLYRPSEPLRFFHCSLPQILSIHRNLLCIQRSPINDAYAL